MNYPVKILSQLRPILKGFRKARQLTQADVAKKLGITQQSYAQLEANPASASIERLFKVLQILEVDLILADKPVEEKEEKTNLSQKLNDILNTPAKEIFASYSIPASVLLNAKLAHDQKKEEATNLPQNLQDILNIPVKDLFASSSIPASVLFDKLRKKEKW